MRKASPLIILTFLLSAAAATAADKGLVKDQWHTPYDLYLDPQEAFAMKTADPAGVTLIDVRAIAEIQFVGFSNLADANIPIYTFHPDAWKDARDGIHGKFRKRRNRDFVAAVDELLRQRGLDRDSPIILMCTSGGRSPVAAKVLHAAGFGRVYTQYQGFEGIKAKSGPHAGQRVVNGWRNAGLPWGYKLEKSRMYFNFAPTGDVAAGQ